MMGPHNEEYSATVVVADDDPDFRKAFADMLSIGGYRVIEAGDRHAIIDAITGIQPDLLTLDLEWEDEPENGIDILSRVKAVDPILPVVMLTGQGTIRTAIEATRGGAFDYIEKTYDRARIMVTIRNAIESGRLRRQNERFFAEETERYRLVGESVMMRRITEHIRKAGPAESVVLITGESGTGKELAARQIHLHSARREHKFVSIDSGTLADSLAESELFGHKRGAFTGAVEDRSGLIEEAEGGTLFLDEIGNASASLQAKLLHVVQEREYRRVGENTVRRCDVRIIAATNQNLPRLIDDGKFRSDLYYRLKVVEIPIPPLRERKEDVPLLAKHFFEGKTHKCNYHDRLLSSEAVNLLVDYDWPGNVRELENAIERIVVFSEAGVIGPDDVKSILGDVWLRDEGQLRSLNEMTRQFRRECIIKAINLADGKIARAAQILRIDRTHLHKLINEYELRGGD